MAGYGRDEALAFIGAMRLQLTGKVGFSWLVAKLADLEEYVASLAEENEAARAYLEQRGEVDAFERFRAARGETGPDRPGGQS